MTDISKLLSSLTAAELAELMEKTKAAEVPIVAQATLTKKRCSSCGTYKLLPAFITKTNKKSLSCCDCRVAYMKHKTEQENEAAKISDIKQCKTCLKMKPFADYTKDYLGEVKIYPACHACRLEWFNKQNPNAETEETTSTE